MLNLSSAYSGNALTSSLSVFLCWAIHVPFIILNSKSFLFRTLSSLIWSLQAGFRISISLFVTTSARTSKAWGRKPVSLYTWASCSHHGFFFRYTFLTIAVFHTTLFCIYHTSIRLASIYKTKLLQNLYICCLWKHLYRLVYCSHLEHLSPIGFLERLEIVLVPVYSLDFIHSMFNSNLTVVRDMWRKLRT